MAELLPCPFCGHEAELYIRFGYNFIACRQCHAHIMFSDVEREIAKTIERYNTRKPKERGGEK